GYSANRQVARSRKPDSPASEPGELTRVATPGAATIEALAHLLDVPAAATAKAVLYTAEGGPHDTDLIFAVVRGDTELNETKLAKAAQAARLRPATEEEIRAAGAEPGYASP